MDQEVNNKTNQKPKIKSKKKRRHNSEIVSINPVKVSIQNQQTMILNDAMSREQMVVSQFSNQQNIPPFQVNQMYIQPSPQPVIVTNRAEFGVPQMPNIPYINNINNINNQQVDDNIIRLRGRSQMFTCPYCHKVMKTNIEDKCNCGSCLVYFFIFLIPITIFIYFFFINNTGCECKFECRLTDRGCGCFPTCCRCPERDNMDNCHCCCDVDHYCPYCRKLIGTRNAWADICPPCCCCCCCSEKVNILNLNEINNNNNINNNINN